MAERDQDDRLRRALELVASEARRRVDARTTTGTAPPASLEITLRIPLPATPEPLARSRDELDEELDEEIRTLVASRAIWEPGHVYCLRCGSAGCEHSAVDDPRQVFAGWGSTGIPRFEDLGQLLLERRHPEVDRLYRSSPGFVATAMNSDDLVADLLPAYREHLDAVRIHGQVVAGWWTVPSGHGDLDRVAATFQVLSVGRERRRYVLHLAGAVADPVVLDSLFSRHREIPWRSTAAWAEETLGTIGAAARRKGKEKANVDRRIAGLLESVANHLGRPVRGRRRRTGHGQERHDSGRRPTGAAVSDLLEAPRERVLFDRRRKTFVVLGPKGRTHVFRHDGKLVTSVRYGASTVQRRQKTGRWRPASGREAEGLAGAVRSLVERGAEEG